MPKGDDVWEELLTTFLDAIIWRIMRHFPTITQPSLIRTCCSADLASSQGPELQEYGKPIKAGTKNVETYPNMKPGQGYQQFPWILPGIIPKSSNIHRIVLHLLSFLLRFLIHGFATEKQFPKLAIELGCRIVHHFHATIADSTQTFGEKHICAMVKSRKHGEWSSQIR